MDFISQLSFTVLLCLLPFVFASCEDDDVELAKSNLIGTWKQEKGINTSRNTDIHFKFRERYVSIDDFKSPIATVSLYSYPKGSSAYYSVDEERNLISFYNVLTFVSKPNDTIETDTYHWQVKSFNDRYFITDIFNFKDSLMAIDGVFTKM